VWRCWLCEGGIVRNLGFCPIVESYCALDDDLNAPNIISFQFFFVTSLAAYAINER